MSSARIERAPVATAVDRQAAIEHFELLLVAGRARVGDAPHANAAVPGPRLVGPLRDPEMTPVGGGRVTARFVENDARCEADRHPDPGLDSGRWLAWCDRLDPEVVARREEVVELAGGPSQ